MFETYAYFFVSDFDVDPGEISKRLKIEPTTVWLKGDKWLPNRSKPNNGWEIHSPIERSEIFINRHIEAVLDIIEPELVQILLLQEQSFKVGINCVGYYYDEHPGFHLSVELISRLAAFSIAVDFDLYCLCEKKEEY